MYCNFKITAEKQGGKINQKQKGSKLKKFNIKRPPSFSDESFEYLKDGLNNLRNANYDIIKTVYFFCSF